MFRKLCHFCWFLAVAVAAAAAADAKTNCAAMNGRECRASEDCSWDCRIDPKRPFACASKYFCRLKEDPCEKGFRQTDFDVFPDGEAVKRCAGKEGCVFVHEGCYCICDDIEPAECDCACGGGAPPNCNSHDKK